MKIKEEFDKRMCETYPDIFRERNLPMSETCMCWGFDIGPGWYDIIEIACKQIKFISDQTGVEIVAKQIKEKFGTLRFYIGVYWPKDSKISNEEIGITEDIIDTIINNAEMMSANTCEECGEPGSLRVNGWLVTLCEKCYDKRFNKK